MANELQDGFLILKDNGKFRFHMNLWMILNFKTSKNTGTYVQVKDTLFLDWEGTDPKNIKPYLSRKCILDSSGMLWFVEEHTNKKLWSMREKRINPAANP